jgi:hypothetical protein
MNISKTFNRAFPSTYSYEENIGLSKRELFAAMAMQGLLASYADLPLGTLDVHFQAIKIADALIKALEESSQEKKE